MIGSIHKLLTLACLAAIWPAAAEATRVVQTDKLIPDTGAQNREFGNTVAIEGDRVVVGLGSQADNSPDTGMAYLFDAATGQQQGMLISDDAAPGDGLGFSVAIDGGVIVVGAPGDDDDGRRSGSAYLFDAATGSQLGKLTAADGAELDNFGDAVGIGGGVAIVGSPFDDAPGFNSGSAYLFDVATGGQLHKLTPEDRLAAYAGFGSAVAVGGGVAAVGVREDAPNGTRSGSAYLFNTATGVQITKLAPDDAAAGDFFGQSVATDGRFVLVGAPGENRTRDTPGAAYVFDAVTGQQLRKLTATDGEADDLFGYSVAIDGRFALIGAVLDDDLAANSGAAYLFDLTTGEQLDKLTAADGGFADDFGWSVDLSGDVIVAGSPLDSPLALRSGSAYLFAVVPEPSSAALLLIAATYSLTRFGIVKE